MVNFPDMPPLCTAELDQLGKVVDVLSELCYRLQLPSLCLNWPSSQVEAEVVLELECTDFVRFLSAIDARVWKKRWKESVMRGEWVSFRRWRVERLRSIPPLEL